MGELYFYFLFVALGIQQYSHLWPVGLYNVFQHYHINGTILERKVIEHKMYVSIFSTTGVCDISHSRRTEI